MKNSNIIIAAIIGVCFMLAFVFAGRYIYMSKQTKKTISVVGLAEKDFVSDLIVWNLSYNVQMMDQKAAYQDIKRKTEIVTKHLLDNGIKQSEMVLEPISSDKEYNYYYDKEAERSFQTFAGYKLSQKIKIESSDIDKVEEVYRGISVLLDKDIDISSSSPSYYYTKLADLKIEMLANASEDAKNRAETIASNAGSRLGDLVVANMGVFQITAPNSDEEDYSWGGTFNTSSKMKRASINMRLTYELK